MNKEKYILNPKQCLYCLKQIEYEKQYNKFCNSSCAASHNNKYHSGFRSEKGLTNIREANAKRKNPNKPIREVRINKVKNYLANPNSCIVCNSLFDYKDRRRKLCQDKSCKTTFFSNLMRKNVKNKKVGGFRRIVTYYESPTAGKVCLESSYEVTLAKTLDNNNITWCRPEPFEWKDKNNVLHYYFPDFHLIDYDIYLDPKNDFLIKKDSDKIQRVINQNNVKLFVLNKSQLDIKYIKELIIS